MPMASPPPASRLTVLLVGASGLVGRHALLQLLADPAVGEVRVWLRRPLTPAGLLGSAHVPGMDKLRLQQIDFTKMTEHAATLVGVDWVLCALGTTIRQAGSQAAFRQVDHDYPLALARLAKAAGVPAFGLVSAVGADARSRVFYNRVKGELEAALRGLGLPHVTVVRPSLLAGERAEFRLGERLGLCFGFLMPPAYRPVQAWQVAAGLIHGLKQQPTGWQVIDNVRLRAMR